MRLISLSDNAKHSNSGERRYFGFSYFLSKKGRPSQYNRFGQVFFSINI